VKWLSLVVACGCSGAAPRGPGGAEAPVIDRFSAAAAHLMVRTAANHLPGPDQPIDFDHPPFVTQSFGPDGAVVRYYNLDVQPERHATLWRFTRAGTHERLAGQLDVVDRIPGDAGYTDFWRIAWVEVPADFVPGSITAAAQIRERGFPIAADPAIVDCPIVPRGSTAREGGVPTELWYRGAKVMCLGFGEPLHEQDGRVPTSPIYVTFGHDEAFEHEPGTPAQTHNVVFSVPGDADYSPLWAVHVYDRAAFAQVHDEATALRAPVVKEAPPVNCPIVYVAPRN
jgi:hypothetical protein